MPKPSLDTQAAVQAMIYALNSTIPHESFRANPQLLVEQIQATPSFNWQKAADIMNLPKSKLYHWYRETFSRRLKQQLTPMDLDKLKEIVRAAVKSNQEITVEQIKRQLSQTYDNQIIYVAMQNTKKARDLARLLPLEQPPKYQVPPYKIAAMSQIERKSSELVTPRTARSVIEEENASSTKLEPLSLEWGKSDEELEFSLF